MGKPQIHVGSLSLLCWRFEDLESSRWHNVGWTLVNLLNSGQIRANCFVKILFLCRPSSVSNGHFFYLMWFNFFQCSSSQPSSCRIRSDRHTTSLTLTTGVCEAGRKMRGASNMNIHYDVTCLLTAAWRSHSGQIVWATWSNCELAREKERGGGFWTHSTYTGYPGSAGGRQLDRWRWSTVGYDGRHVLV